MSTTTTAPAAIGRPGEGEARWWFGSLAEILITADDTGGALSVVEVTEAPGAEAPLHVHHRDDETFVVLDGEVTFEVGGRTVAARAGDTVFAPRRVPHRFTAGPSGCRMLFLLTPGGFEGLVRETSVPAGARTLPPPTHPGPDMELVAAAVVAHGCELLD